MINQLPMERNVIVKNVISSMKWKIVNVWNVKTKIYVKNLITLELIVLVNYV